MTESIRSIIDTRFGGVLRAGLHFPDGEACALEAASVVRGVEWTDNPRLVGLPDLRPINDGPWSSDQARTEALVPVLDALWDWSEWPEERRVAWVQAVARRTIGEVLPAVLRTVGLEAEAARCERKPTADAAKRAARAAWAAAEAAAGATEAAARAAEAATWATEAAAWAAEAAKRAAWASTEAAAWAAEAAKRAARAAKRAAASDDILRLACRIWIEEGRKV